MLFDLISFFPFLAVTVVLTGDSKHWFTVWTQLLQISSVFGVTAARHKLPTAQGS